MEDFKGFWNAVMEKVRVVWKFGYGEVQGY